MVFFIKETNRTLPQKPLRQDARQKHKMDGPDDDEAPPPEDGARERLAFSALLG
jgi:hypothetical protein